MTSNEELHEKALKIANDRIAANDVEAIKQSLIRAGILTEDGKLKRFRISEV